MIEDIKKTLWATADKLRANMDAAEYKHIVLGLIFVKYISDTFQTRRAELTRKFADSQDDYYLGDADPDLIKAELEDRDYYKEVNVFWVPEAARWESLRAQAKQADIGKRIDDALSLIETENPKLKGILDKRYARVQLPDGKLGELVDLVSKIGFGNLAKQKTGPKIMPVICSAKFMNTFLGSLPVPKVNAAASSIPPPASLKLWSPYSPRIMVKFMTLAAVPAVCLCNRKNSSKPTAAKSAMSLSMDRNPTPPPGGWRR